jgi:hypothetical protein
MIRLLTALFLAMTLMHSPSIAREPEPSFPDNVEFTASAYDLSKLGEYRYVYRIFFQLYDAALYTAPGAKVEDVLNATTSFRLQFRYLREIDKSIILESSDRMLRKNLSDEQFQQIAERVARINDAYRTVKDGDHSALTYQPGNGTTLTINGEPIITIEGEDFAQLYFQIWLGEQPISKSLRENLLGLVD